MTKKIVAIGGGECGRLKSNGTHAPYETELMDKEIIRLTNKEHPHFLLLAHSQLQSLEAQDFYFNTMKDIYSNLYNCECKMLRSDKINDKEYVVNLIDWADIIYEGGGNTLDMIDLWKSSGFDEILKEAWEHGKVLCGVSAGANCWFEECSSDSLKIKYGDDQPLISMKCLGFQKGLFVPHADAPGRKESVKEILKGSHQIGILVSNCAALEIIDTTYRILTTDASNYHITPYVLKAYYIDDTYIEEPIDISSEFRDITELYMMRRL